MSGENTASPLIDWDDSAGASSYAIWFINLDNGTLVSSDTLSTSQFTASGLSNGNYRIWVRAINGIGSSGWSAPFDFTVGSAPTAPPPAPAGFSVSGETTASPTIDWDDAEGASSYATWFVNLDTGTLVSSETLSTSQFTASGLSNGNYRIFVRAINGIGSSSWSAPFDLTVSIPSSSTASAAIGGPLPKAEAVEELNAEDAEEILAEAISRYEQAGLADEQVELLYSVEIVIADLSDWTLGRADEDTIYLDVDAAGFGWYVDSTPLDDSEFDNGDTSVSERMDLLTVVMHELGHVLGLDDVFDEHDHSLMSAWLSPGERRVLDEDAVDQVLGNAD